MRRYHVKIFADTAVPHEIIALREGGRVSGFTTNPTLFRAAGATDYLEHARAVLDAAAGHPVSIEVIADDPIEMRRQALVLAALSPHVHVKIPIMTSTGAPTYDLIAELLADGRVAINVTAVFTQQQAYALGDLFARRLLAPIIAPPIVSIFAGRIADSGRDPSLEVRDLMDLLAGHSYGDRPVYGDRPFYVLWASSRQVYDVVQADGVSCDIITMTPALIAKLPLLGKDLGEFSRETVEMFDHDARAAGFTF